MGGSLEDTVECYKVVTEDMESLGLRKNTNILTYSIGEWFSEENPIEGPSDEGGLWAAKTRGRANDLKKYMKEQHGINTKIFKSLAKGILHQNSYRIKVREILLEEEIV